MSSTRVESTELEALPKHKDTETTSKEDLLQELQKLKEENEKMKKELSQGPPERQNSSSALTRTDSKEGSNTHTCSDSEDDDHNTDSASLTSDGNALERDMEGSKASMSVDDYLGHSRARASSIFFTGKYVEILLDDFSLIPGIAKQCSDIADFARLLYKYYDVNGKSTALLRWAIDQEIALASTNLSGEFCRNETLTTKLFHVILFGDLGKKYISNLLLPLVKDVVESNRYLEIDSMKVDMEHANEIEPNIKWVLEKLEDFIRRLKETTMMCPVLLRESFAYLRKSLAEKLDTSLQMTTSLFFLRFICPSLVFPEDHSLVNKEEFKISSGARSRLVLVSKILQALANGAKLEENKFSAKTINDFIDNNYKEVLGFLQLLLDDSVIEMAKTVIQASVHIVVPDSEKKEAEGNLQKYLQSLLGGRDLELTFNYKNEYNKVLEMFMTPLSEWKQMSQDKKRGVMVYGKKSENGVIFMRGVVKLKGDMRSMFNELHELGHQNKFNTRIENAEKLKIYEDEDPNLLHVDWYVKTRPGSVSKTARDYVFTRYDEWNPKRSIFVGYSVSLEDKPPTKGYVRGVIVGSGMVLEESDEAGFLNLTVIGPIVQKNNMLLNVGGTDLGSYLTKFMKFYVPKKEKEEKKKETKEKDKDSKSSGSKDGHHHHKKKKKDILWI